MDYRQDGEWNKIILRTAQIPAFYSVHNATFADTENGGLICIAHTEPELSCATHCMSQAVDPASMAISKSYLTNKDHYSDSENWKCGPEDLPKWCQRKTRYRAAVSDKCTMFQEEDLDHMELLVFHYRVKSWEDWKRKTESQGRRGINQYRGLEKDANRPDIYDDFMVSVRQPARRYHPFYIHAQEVMKICPDKYFSHRNGSALQIEPSGGTSR